MTCGSQHDAGSQTDTHLAMPGKDPQYQWNEWDMRREALALDRFREKTTHGAQTDTSGFTRHCASQVHNIDTYHGH